MNESNSWPSTTLSSIFERSVNDLKPQIYCSTSPQNDLSSSKALLALLSLISFTSLSTSLQRFDTRSTALSKYQTFSEGTKSMLGSTRR